MKPSEHAKAKGFRTLRQVADILCLSEQQLCRAHNEKPDLFQEYLEEAAKHTTNTHLTQSDRENMKALYEEYKVRKAYAAGILEDALRRMQWTITKTRKLNSPQDAKRPI